MADIPIQRKEGRSFWPWLIGILVLVALIWFLFGRHRNPTPANGMADTTATMTAPAPAGATPATPAPSTTTPGTTPTTGSPTPPPRP